MPTEDRVRRSTRSAAAELQKSEAGSKKRTRSAAAVVQKSEAISKKRKVAKEPSPAEQDESEQSEDDQTETFLKGFESSEEEGPDAEDFKEGRVVPNIPADKKVKQKLDKAKTRQSESKPGVIYVG